MSTQLRGLHPDQWDDFFDRVARAFHGTHDSGHERAMWRRLVEFERVVTAWDGGELVGSAGAHSFRMTVPGGALLDVPGVTMVTVQPTHTRRGILTAMMRRQLDDFHERGEAVAILTASEPAIYGRFGYGIATYEMRGVVDTARTAIRAPEAADGVRLRLAEPAAVVGECERVYALTVPARAGMLARRPGWEEKALLDDPADREGAGPLLCVLAEVGGEVRGYARYSVTPGGGAAGPAGTVNVRDLASPDPAVYAALWRYLASIDLTTAVAFGNVPEDDPLLHLVSDPRRCDLRRRDSTHLRLVDVGAALSARAYTTPIDVVLEVTDAFCPWNEGRWRLSGSPEGATCTRTNSPADLALDTRSLAAAYLGGPTLTALSTATLATELTPATLPPTATAFHTPTSPWLPHGF